MKRLALCFVIVTFFLGLLSAPASSQYTSGISLSGAVVNALVQAYERTRLGNDQDAPLALLDYLVAITQWNNGKAPSKTASFQVIFGRETTREYHSFFVNVETGAVTASQHPNYYFGGGIVLPGITVGSIIACYRFALSDKRLPETDIQKLRSGAFNMFVDPGWSASAVSFSALPSVPEKVSMFPAPTPTPSSSPKVVCAGACGNTFVSYVVSTLDGKVTIKTTVIL